MTDKQYLKLAIEISKKSKEPVECGCVIVSDNKIVAECFNSQRADNVAVSHAELKAVYLANQKTGARKLRNAVAYCTCEPCAMCLTALSYAEIERIVFNKTMSELFPDDPQSKLDSKEFVGGLNFVPKLEHVLL